jgi:hypothetical protein
MEFASVQISGFAIAKIGFSNRTINASFYYLYNKEIGGVVASIAHIGVEL